MIDEQTNDCGLASDGDRVVIDLRKYRFSDHCLITGEPVEGEQSLVYMYTWELELAQPESGDDFHKAIHNSWNIGPLRVNCIMLRLPLLARFPRRRTWPAVLLALLGAVISIVGVGLTFIAALVWQWPRFAVAVPIILGMGLITAAVRALVRRPAPLSIHRVCDGYLWLNGVHPSVRQTLPAWRHSPAEGAHRKRVLRSWLGVGVVTLLIGMVLFTVRRRDLADAVASRHWLRTQGEIESSVVVFTGSRGDRRHPRRDEFEVQVKYNFLVRGEPYRGSRIGFGRSHKRDSRGSAEELQLRSYGAGKSVDVYFQSSDPNRSSLSQATVFDTIVLAFFPTLATAFGAGSLLYWARLAWSGRPPGAG